MSNQPFIFIKDASNHLSAADPWTYERLDALPVGKELKAATLTQPRSLPFQGYYWVMLSNIVKATECAATHDHLHKALLKLSGYVSPIYNAKGQVVELSVDSTRFDKMNQDEFETYVKKAKKVLAEQLGIVWDDYENKAA